MEKWEKLLALVPVPPDWTIPWHLIETSECSAFINKMKETPQNPLWHGEGDVWTHTCMMCEKLAETEEFRLLERRKQEEVFVASLLHDIGKIPCTHLENGNWTSPNHTVVGSRMAREFLWTEYGFCGTEKLQQFRETVCELIRYHSVPLHILDVERPEYRLIKVASQGELTGDFTLELLYLLSGADIKGRVCDSLENSLEAMELGRLLADECGCYKTPLKFPSEFSKYAYLKGRNIMPGQELYDDTWGEIILMSGLPGTGKDTWIGEHLGEYPVISLDNLRKALKVAPGENQGAVISAARELAKEYLRKKIPFVWNATSLTPMLREKQIQLFTNYGGAVRIVYLETEWEEQLSRNRNRKDVVPEQVIGHMLNSLMLPERFEAQKVKWYCV